MASYPDAGLRPSRLTRRLTLSGLLLLWALLAVSQAAVTSAITGDGTLGTTVTQSGRTYAIGGGTLRGSNLFQSFERFSVGTGDIATFTGPTGTTNILNRVTGGQLSEIDGLLRSEITGANLYLLNPSGVMFGPNASLDVSGSFHVSTADYLRMADGARFSANLGQESVLTVAEPGAFGFVGSTPAPITIQGSLLRVNDGQTMSVVGGDMTILGRGSPIRVDTIPTLDAPSGRIQLTSVAAPGEVVFSPLELAPDLQEDSLTRLGRIELSQAALVTARTEGSRQAGAIAVQGGQVMLSGGSQLTSNTAGTDSTGAAGRIVVAAPVVSLTEQAHIEARARSRSHGNAGEVKVRAGTLTLTDGSSISTDTSGTGRAGMIELRVGTLTLTDGPSGAETNISTDTNGPGQGGLLTVMADEAIMIAGPRSESHLSSRGTEGGAGGRMRITTPRLSMSHGALIRAGTTGAGPGGTIELRVGTLTVTRGGISVITNNEGSGGTIDVQVGTLTLTNGGAITTTAEGPGQGGRLTITAREAVMITGQGPVEPSRLTSRARGHGAAGRIVVDTPRLSISDGGTIRAGTTGAGPGGTIELRVGTLTLSNGGTITTDTSGSGQGGNLQIMAPRIELRDGGTIAASSSGTGPAGTLLLQAGETFRSHQGAVTTGATRAGGGRIELSAGRLVQLQDSALTTTVQGGGGDAGNLTLDAPFIVMDNSQIIANAVAGMGGHVQINSNVFLADPASVVSASSELGISGTVAIQAPVTMLSGTLAPLPQAFVNVAELLPVRCAARAAGGRYSSLVLGGRNGLPAEPSGVLPSPLALDERLVADSTVTGAHGRQTSSARFALLAGQEKALPRLRGAYRDLGCTP
jgi:filamentous hemagglutinin family protein